MLSEDFNDEMLRVWGLNSLPDIRANLTSANCRRMKNTNFQSTLEGNILPIAKPIVRDLFHSAPYKDNIGLLNRLDEIDENLNFWKELEQLEEILETAYTLVNRELDKILQEYVYKYRLITDDLELTLKRLKVWPHLHRLGVQYNDVERTLVNVSHENILNMKTRLIETIKVYESDYSKEKQELERRIYTLKHKSEFMAMLAYEKEFYDKIYCKPARLY